MKKSPQAEDPPEQQTGEAEAVPAQPADAAGGAGAESGAPEAGADSEAPAEAAVDGAPGEAEPEADRVAELMDRLIRLQADFENYRRRVQREKEEIAQYGTQRLLINLLPVLDNLERALATPPNPGDERLRQGVELTARSFLEVLAKEGVKPIEAVGQPFDPHLHEAVMTGDDPDKEEGIVLEEFRKGYMLGDRVIRASMVKVNTRS